MMRPLYAVLVCALIFAALVPAKASALEINEGIGDVPYGAKCSKAFTDSDWKDAQLAPLWDDSTRELRLTYDPDIVAKSQYNVRSRLHEKLDFDDFSLITVLYLCNKKTDSFDGIIASFSILTTPALEKRLRKQFGEPDEVTPIYSLWDAQDYFIQLNLNELIVYSKKAAGQTQ